MPQQIPSQISWTTKEVVYAAGGLDVLSSACQALSDDGYTIFSINNGAHLNQFCIFAYK